MDLLDEEKVLNLCNQSIKRLTRNFFNKDKAANITHLHLDCNELQKLEFLTGLTNVVEFTASQNQLFRMYNIAPLKNLVNVDLSYNKIICIEGLKDLIHLTSLNLSHNKIKEIDHLFTNAALEYLDLSDNLISCLANISQLSKLKKLFLHTNMIHQLRHAEVYLPKNIETLTLANNKIADLNEISRLVGIVNLKEISLKGNPCVDMTGQTIGFDYRPFLVNWCLELKIIDGYAVDELESLRGEWLYSQGKGRQFRPGEHAQLVQYLAENLPFNNEPLQSEQERKLRLILSKAQQHQSQLMTESSTGGKISSHLMTRSLDFSSLQGYKEKPSPPLRILSQSLHCPSTSTHKDEDTKQEEIPAPLPAASKLVPVPESLISPMVSNIPDIGTSISAKPSTSSQETYYTCEGTSTTKLPTIKSKTDIGVSTSAKPSTSSSDPYYICEGTSTTKLPTMKSKTDIGVSTSAKSCTSLPDSYYISEGTSTTKLPTMKSKTDIGVSTIAKPSTSSQDPYIICQGMSSMKLRTIKTKANEMRSKKFNTDRDLAATCIQKNWRGYFCRNSNPTLQTFYQQVRMRRVNHHIGKLSGEVNSLKTALDNEHRLHLLQMQAINALWRKVQQLQGTMQDVMRVITPNTSSSTTVDASTQTDIIAVRTPDDSGFLYHRPSTLPLCTHPVSGFIESFIDNVFKDAEEKESSDDQQ